MWPSRVSIHQSNAFLSHKHSRQWEGEYQPFKFEPFKFPDAHHLLSHEMVTAAAIKIKKNSHSHPLPPPQKNRVSKNLYVWVLPSSCAQGPSKITSSPVKSKSKHDG